MQSITFTRKTKNMEFLFSKHDIYIMLPRRKLTFQQIKLD